MTIKFVRDREGRLKRFKPEKLESAIGKAVENVHLVGAVEAIKKIYHGSIEDLNSRFNGNPPNISDIERAIIETATRVGYESVAHAFKSYRDKREEVRKRLAIATKVEDGNTTDAALLITSDSKEVVGVWDRKRVMQQLEEEAGLSDELAKDISKRVENHILDLYDRGIRRLSTTDVRHFVDLEMTQEGLDVQRRKQASLSIPKSDLNSIIFSKSQENSNVGSNNPEAVNLEIAERIQKPFALEDIFSPDVAEAHLKGAIHLHDLGYPTRVYCSSHSLEYIKKYGLDKVLANLESKSNPPNSAAVLNQHVQTFLASLQAHYAGALGFGFVNIFYSPLLNRPVDVITGKLNGVEMKIEKRDLEKLVEQGVWKTEKPAKLTDEQRRVLTEQVGEQRVKELERLTERTENYFEVVSTKKEMRELPYKEFEQTAQNLIFAASQNAFSRGGQTLFIDFNLHTGVPHYLKNVPAIGPGGKYMVQMPDGEVKMVKEIPRYMNNEDGKDPKNGDALSEALDGELKGGKIIIYGDLEKTSQKFTRAMIDVWKKGDKDGRPFHFPKCDLHVDEHTFEDKTQEELFDFAAEVAAQHGSVYFMFDRGTGVNLAQCCRLREKVTDPVMIKHPERLRFVGFQNVTVNLPQAVYKGKMKGKTLDEQLAGTFAEIDSAMELALKAHYQKAEFIQKLLDTDGSPQRSLGVASDDGDPYVNLKKATYIIGNLGLNEAVQALTGKQLHESEEAYRLGLEIVGHMYKKIHEFKERTGLKFTIEETPGESTTRRFAKVDRQAYPEARKVIKGTEENPYYTNSIHFSPDADIGFVHRLEGQSRFHDMIESGAIVHDWSGEQNPGKEVIKHLVKNTLYNTRCAQLVFSPTFTECDSCGNIMNGDSKICTNGSCMNHTQEGLVKNERKIHVVTRIVGYNSRLDHWNGSQIQIYEDRKKAENFYAGKEGRDMGWLYNPDGHDKLKIIEFGKVGCPSCDHLKRNLDKEIKSLGLEGSVDYQVHNLDSRDEKSLTEAAMYNIPLDTVPSLVIAGKSGYYRKVASVPACTDGACQLLVEVAPAEEIGREIAQRAQEYK